MIADDELYMIVGVLIIWICPGVSGCLMLFRDAQFFLRLRFSESEVGDLKHSWFEYGFGLCNWGCTAFGL